MVQHIKRSKAPNTWPIVRKGKSRWIISPNPSSQSQKLCLPLVVAMRDLLKLAETLREVKRILHNNEVLINNRRIKDTHFAIGLFDVLTIKELNKSYRLVLTKNNKLAFVEIKKNEANILPLKIKNKTVIKKGGQQINFTNGWNLLIKGKYKVSDVILYDTIKRKVAETLFLKKGANVALIGGKYVGKLAIFKSIEVSGKLRKTKQAVVDFKEKGSSKTIELRTKLDYVFVTGNKTQKFTATIE